MNLNELKSLLIDRLEDVVQYLMPNGTRHGNYWKVGDVHGNPGQSLSICLAGGRKGLWLEGNGAEGGDIVELWCLNRGITNREARKEIMAFCGVRPNEYLAPTKKYDKPKEDFKPIKRSDEVTQYLVGERRIDINVLSKSMIAQRSFGKPAMAFKYVLDGEVQMVKYINLERDEKGKKIVSCSSNSRPILFGMESELVRKSKGILVICEGECYDGETEVLTRDGWVKFKDYSGQNVAQWNWDHKIEMVTPITIIKKQYSGEMLSISNPQYDFHVTPNHKMVRWDTRNNPTAQLAKDLKLCGTLPKCGHLKGSGVDLSDDQIKLCIAVSADCKIDHRSGTGWKKPMEMRYAHAGFKKSRKIERMRSILLSASVKFTENLGENGYTYFSFGIPEWCSDRMLPWSWISDLSYRQRRLVLDELVLWDGNKVPNRKQTEYSSKYIENASWVQTLASTSGMASSIINRSNKFGSWYKVSILHDKTRASYQSARIKKIEVNTDVFCVTVPSGMLMTRRSNRIAVCGNCDAFSWLSCGVPAVSVPFGAKGEKETGGSPNDEWIANCFQWLEDFKTIYIAMDMDEEGQEAAGAIAKRLGRDRCLMVEMPFNDANECLKNDVDLKSLLKEAKMKDPDDIKVASSMTDRIWNEIQKGEPGKRGDSMFDWEDFELRFREFESTGWCGYNGSGKTTCVRQLMAYFAGVRKMPVFVGSYEEKADRYIALMLQQVAKRFIDPSNFEEYKRFSKNILDLVIVHDVEGTASYKDFFQNAKYAARRYGVKHAVFDNISMSDVDVEDKAQCDKFMKAAQDFWKSTGVHLHIILHPRKGMDEKKPPGKMDVKGSGTFTDLLWNGVTIHRDPETGETNLITWKQRATGKHPSTRLYFQEKSGRLTRKPIDYDNPYICDEIPEEEGTVCPEVDDTTDIDNPF